MDLGCGDGQLLAHLQQHKQTNGYGLDVDPQNIDTCIRNGVNVIEQDLNRGLSNFADDSFDMVVMTETLQSVENPHLLLKDMLRIGHECIVTFPNFGNWRCRLQLARFGRMPVSGHLPYEWYNTPNIRLCTFKDFETLCRDNDLSIIERFVTDPEYHNRPLINKFPNFFGTIAFYRLGRG